MASEDSGRPEFSLVLSAADIAEPFFDAFRAAGVHPGGYGWQEVAIRILEEDMGEIVQEIDFEFDSESDTFVVNAINASALMDLGRRLSELYLDRLRLMRMLEVIR